MKKNKSTTKAKGKKPTKRRKALQHDDVNLRDAVSGARKLTSLGTDPKEVAELCSMAAARLAARGVSGLLVGTAALVLHGIPAPVRDIDFLVIDDGVDPYQRRKGQNMIGDVNVDFIPCERENRRRFYRPERASFLGRDNNIPVAAIEDVIALKRWANRRKDRALLKRWDARAQKLRKLFAR